MNRVLDDLIASAKNLASKAEKATDKAVAYSKLKYQSVQLASELKELYEKLGNAVYTMVKSDFDNKELMDSIISEIDEVKNTLQLVTAKMAEYKNTVICSACGAVNEKDAAYCNKCGNRFPPKAEDAAVDSCECCEETTECTCEDVPEEECCCKAEADTCCTEDSCGCKADTQETEESNKE